MVEKPRPEDAPSNLAIIGRYILTPDIFELSDHLHAAMIQPRPPVGHARACRAGQ